jgi:hypothetical protein
VAELADGAAADETLLSMPDRKKFIARSPLSFSKLKV